MSHPHTTIPAPAYWASYLVNNDPSGLSREEKMQADAWLAREQVRILDTARSDDGAGAEPYFSKGWRLLVPEADCDAGDLLDYIAEELSIDEG